MNKYTNLKSGIEYVDFTLQNYADCYPYLDEESIVRFTDLFTSLKNHEISIGNKIINRTPLDGIMLNNSNKTIYRNVQSLHQQLYEINTLIDAQDKQESLFFKSVVCLCDSINYLSTNELFELNTLFGNIQSRNQQINAPISDSASLFYSYNRYPKKR